MFLSNSSTSHAEGTLRAIAFSQMKHLLSHCNKGKSINKGKAPTEISPQLTTECGTNLNNQFIL